MIGGGKLARLPWKQTLAGLLLIAVFGMVRMPYERSLELELREAGFREWSPNVDNRDQLGQAGFAGALGGFRSLVALFYDVKAHTARVNKDWSEVEKYRNVTTTLQPRFWKHWDIAALDMAWNAFAHFRRVSEEYKDDFRGWEAENVTMPRYLEKGIAFAERGYKWLPDSFRMPRIVADIYSQKYEDKCEAAEWYLKAASEPDAPPHMFRFYAHHLVLCPGREEDAYPIVSELYWGGQRTPTMREDMEVLEDFFSKRDSEGKIRAELEAAVAAPGADYRALATLAMFLKEGGGTLDEAIAAYGALAQDENAPVFYRKKWAILLGKDAESAPMAYRALRALYTEDPEALLPDDELELRDLETRLKIPDDERLTIAD